MAVRHSTHAMIRCLCEWWKYRVKTLARGGVGAGASIARRIYRIVWLRVGIAVSVAECFYGLGTGVLIICLYYLPPASAPTATPRLNPTSLNLIRFPLWLHLRPCYARACPFPADLACGSAFDRTFGGRLLTPEAASAGSGPALEHQNRPHPSGGGDDISRPRGSSMLKNTRIAPGRRRIPPARAWGVSAVFLPNNHGQTIMVRLRLH
jgi:hypothetical protein